MGHFETFRDIREHAIYDQHARVTVNKGKKKKDGKVELTSYR